MTCPSIVRTAKPEDHQEIWRLFLQGYRENGIFTLAPEKVQWFMTRALAPHTIPPGDTGPRGVIGVIGPVGGTLEGLSFVLISQFWYSNDKHIEELLVYVDPECRKTGHAHALIDWMKEQVETTGLPLMTGIISNERTEAKCRLYRRMLPKIGEFFYLAPKGAGAQLATVASS
mgnify:CR=1 FL=1